MHHLKYPEACPELTLDFRLEWFALELDACLEEDGENDEEYDECNRRKDTLDNALHGYRDLINPVQERHAVGESVDVRDDTDKSHNGAPEYYQCDSD